MAVHLNIDANSKLSELAPRARTGEDVAIAPAGIPQVRLTPVAAPGTQEVGLMPTSQRL
jgi:antitoxin (DNA-binding transcriptional repressor) of toxin-antitoxin stability system